MPASVEMPAPVSATTAFARSHEPARLLQDLLIRLVDIHRRQGCARRSGRATRPEPSPTMPNVSRWHHRRTAARPTPWLGEAKGPRSSLGVRVGECRDRQAVKAAPFNAAAQPTPSAQTDGAPADRRTIGLECPVLELGPSCARALNGPRRPGGPGAVTLPARGPPEPAVDVVAVDHGVAGGIRCRCR